MPQNNNEPITSAPPAEKWTVKKVLINLLKLCLGALAIYIIVQKVDLQKVGFYVKQANLLFLLFAFLAFFVSKVIAARRINCYYRTQDLFLSERRNLKLSLLAMFYSLFIPLIGGEGYKVYWLNRQYKKPIKPLIWASLLDRVSGLSALLCLAVLLFPFTSFPFDYKLAALLVIPLLYGTYFFIHRWFFSSFQKVWWQVNAYSLLVQLLQVLCTFSILMALNLDHQVFDYLFIFLLSCLAFVLPFIGAREMAFVLGAEYMGLDTELSLAIGLFFYLSLALTSLVGALFLIFPSLMQDEELLLSE